MMIKKLRVGLLFTHPPKSGGGNAAEMTYFEQILDATSKKHELVLLLDSFDILFPKPLLDMQIINIRQKLLSKIMNKFISSYLVSLLKLKFNIKIFSSFEKKLQKNKIDLIITLGVNPSVSILQEIPFFTFIWDFGHLELPTFKEIAGQNKILVREKINQTQILKARIVYVDSKEGAEKLAFFYRKNPIQIIELPFIPKQNVKLVSMRNKLNYILYPAQYWPHKNHEVLLHAIANLQKKNKNSRKLILTGADKGILEHLKSVAENLNISDKVEFKSFVSEAELEELYYKADAVAMPSLLGPTNFPPLESIVKGTPVFTSQMEGFDDRIKEFMNYISPFDIDSWSAVFNLDSIHERVDSGRVLKVFKEIRRENVAKIVENIDTVSREVRLNTGYEN